MKLGVLFLASEISAIHIKTEPFLLMLRYETLKCDVTISHLFNYFINTLKCE